MEFKIDISESDMKFINEAKMKETTIGKLELGMIGDIVLSNMKLK